VATREVDLGAVQGNDVIVKTGIAAGESVVTAGVHHLHSGQKVRLSEPQP
jgi:hypothetical protein